MAPYTDADIYGENYKPSEDELKAYGESLVKYQEAKEKSTILQDFSHYDNWCVWGLLLPE